MATDFDTVLDTMMVTIRDYKLDNLYDTEPTLFYQILENYMIRGIPKFKECLKSLEYDKSSRTFLSELDMYEVDVVADWGVIEWYTAELQDVLEFKEALNDSDFKRYSTGQNLRPRQDYLNGLREKVKQDSTEYLTLHISELPFFSGVI